MRSLLALLLLCAPSVAQDALPNIVVILADDLGQGDLGCYNAASKVPTPHMDRVAREGLRLTDAHSPSAVCTPTRYGLLTGRYAWRTRMKSGVLVGISSNLIDPERMTIADLLKGAGYRTGAFGKWHLGLGATAPTDYTQPLVPGPCEHGFDTFYGIPASLDMAPYVWVLDRAVVQEPTDKVPGSGHRRQNGGGFWRAGSMAPDFRHIEVLPRVTQRAVEFIERSRREQPEAPFFLYLPLPSPHTPWLPTETWQGKTEIGHYGDFVAQTDHTVGEVLAALERMGIADETLVIVTSDNGSHWPDGDIKKWGHDANNGLRGQKADIFEGGHRVPFLVRWPGRTPAGAVRGDLLCLTDLLATFASIVDADLPEDAGEDSFDQLAVFQNAQLDFPARAHAVHHSHRGVFAVRSGNWKMIPHLGSGGFTAPNTIEPEEGGPTGQLYDLAADLAETNNLWEARPEVVAELAKMLDGWRASGRSR